MQLGIAGSHLDECARRAKREMKAPCLGYKWCSGVALIFWHVGLGRRQSVVGFAACCVIE